MHNVSQTVASYGVNLPSLFYGLASGPGAEEDHLHPSATGGKGYLSTGGGVSPQAANISACKSPGSDEILPHPGDIPLEKPPPYSYPLPPPPPRLPGGLTCGGILFLLVSEYQSYETGRKLGGIDTVAFLEAVVGSSGRGAPSSGADIKAKEEMTYAILLIFADHCSSFIVCTGRTWERDKIKSQRERDCVLIGR